MSTQNGVPPLVKRTVVPRPPPPPRTPRPRTAKRLFLVFCILFLIIVFGFIFGEI